MFDHPYVMEKLMELERRSANPFSPHELPPRPPRGNGLARSVGRAMRRAGEGLEAWAGPGGGSQAGGDYCCPDARQY